MSTKLTLTIDKEIISRAKDFAKNQGRSLSNLIEDYLRTLTTSTTEDFEYTPIVNSLKGVVNIDMESNAIDYKDILEEELLNKYLSEN